MPATLLINATLVKVQDPGGTDTADGPPAPGPTRWEGRSGCWYEERRSRRTNPQTQTSDVYIRRSIVVNDRLRAGPDLVEFETGDVVTFRRHRSQIDQTGVVQNAEHTDPTPGDAGEWLLELELL